MENQNGWVMPTHIVAVAGVVKNADNEILLVKHHRDGWVYPGGQVEVGENLIEAVKREILEESGITAEVGEVFCIASNTGTHPGYNGVKEVPTKLMLDFCCTAAGGELRGSDENDESAWVPEEEVLSWITAPAIRERFTAYLEYAGRPAYLSYVTYPTFRLDLKTRF